MKTSLLITGLLCSAAMTSQQIQAGPYDPAAWPGSADASKIVHYVTTDNQLEPLGETWIQGGLKLLSGGDQTTSPITIGGYPALKVTGTYFNVSDRDFTEWADDDTIDILMEVYGDSGLFNANGNPRNFNFLQGTLPELAAPVGGRIPVEAKNQKWNWTLFRVTNGTRPSDGSRFVGSVPANAQGDFRFGGVNGGSMRLENVQNLIVRVVAWGEKGAFGEPADINQYFPADVCDPEPETNLASIDIAAGTSNHLIAMNNGDQEVETVEGVGPAEDKRKALQPKGSLMNFAITEKYLGSPCNDPHAVKVCVDFYDDPALTGARFGPEAYTTDAISGIAFYARDQWQTLTGTGKWIRRSWVIPSVSLLGINVAPNTAGPRLAFDKGAVAISRFELAVLRTGTHPLAGIDPLVDCISDPLICTDTYGSYAEMDLANGVFTGLAPGNSGGDQTMIQGEAGSPDDRRQALWAAREDGPAAFGNNYVNLALTGQALGPSSQPNARLAICVTYFDGAELKGAKFRPEVYMSERNGIVTFAFTTDAIAKVLEGTDRWREAYFELPDVKFNGVNQGPQAAARFFSSHKIPITRVRYAVIRPCGPNKDINALEECKGVKLHIEPQTAGALRFSWTLSEPGYALEESNNLSDPSSWTPVNVDPTEEATGFSITLTPTETRFYRLRK